MEWAIFKGAEEQSSQFIPFIHYQLVSGRVGLGLICALDEVPGDVDLFIGLDMGGRSQRVPGSAFLFTRNGAQLGWQLGDVQGGERLEDDALAQLLGRSIQECSLEALSHMDRTCPVYL